MLLNKAILAGCMQLLASCHDSVISYGPTFGKIASPEFSTLRCRAMLKHSATFDESAVPTISGGLPENSRRDSNQARHPCRARLRYAANSKWQSRRYPDMSLLSGWPYRKPTAAYWNLHKSRDGTSRSHWAEEPNAVQKEPRASSPVGAKNIRAHYSTDRAKDSRPQMTARHPTTAQPASS